MSYKLCAFAILSIILYITTPTLAGVLRTDYTTNQPTEKSIDAALADTQTTESELPEITTVQYIAGEDVSSSEEVVTIKIAEASLDPAPGTLEGVEITVETIEDAGAKAEKNEEEQKSNEEESNENETDNANKTKTAHSRDEAASIKVNAHETDDLAKEIPQSSVETIHEPQKSSKFLLLSTPRLAREQEENIAEPEDVDINTAVTTDETTELSIEVEAETEKPKEQAEKKPGFISRVRDAIFGEKSAHEAPKKAEEDKASDDNEKQVKHNEEDVKKQDETTTSTAAVENTPTPHNSNAASAVLLETEPEYVIFDSDAAHFEHLGSFTHIDSDEHLQPIVHSVEEVPSHFEEPLLFTSSYVHAW